MRSDPIASVAGRPYWREHDARLIVDAWRISGEPLSRFAPRHGVDPKRLARWANRLKRSESPPLQFHPVRITQADAPGTGTIEIQLHDGPTVRVGRGFQTEDLRRVLAVLEERATC